MVIKSLKLKNYRNYNLLDLNFDPNTNILYGDNAQGKTNILEALYLTGTTKSHRGTKDRDIIQFGYDESHIETIVEKRGICFQIDMHLKKNSPKGIAIDKVPIRKAGELFGIVHFVFFSPEDLNIIKEGPAGRRRRSPETAISYFGKPRTSPRIFPHSEAPAPTPETGKNGLRHPRSSFPFFYCRRLQRMMTLRSNDRSKMPRVLPLRSALRIAL